MKNLSFTLNDNAGANNPFNVWKMITGAQTTGVTIAGGGVTYPAQAVNVGWFKLQSDPTNAAATVFVGDGRVNKTGNGYQIGPGGEYLPPGVPATAAMFSMISLFVAVNGAAIKVHVSWE